METKAAGCVFWMLFLLLLLVTVNLSAAGCVDYKHREVCGLKGSSVTLPCTHPSGTREISHPNWSKMGNYGPKPLAKKKANLTQKKDLRNSNDCTIRLIDLTEEDISLYYFTYKFRNVKGDLATCNGVPGVFLHVVASLVIILVEEIVGRQKVLQTSIAVIEGKSIMLTCVPTCAANLNSNQGYIWYRNKVQINDKKPVLSLNPVSLKDTGSYSCAMINYKDLPSPPFNLEVEARPRETMVNHSDKSPPKIPSMPDPKTSKDKSLFAFSITLAASVCVGWIITITISILVFKAKKKSVSSVPIPNTNTGPYMVLNINSMSNEYDTLDTVGCSSVNETVYENL